VEFYKDSDSQNKEKFTLTTLWPLFQNNLSQVRNNTIFSFCYSDLDESPIQNFCR